MATVAGNLLQRTRCYYFYDPSYAQCNKRVPGSGCAGLQGFNRIHAILGGSDDCVATDPSDMAVAMAALDATVQVKGPQGERSIPFAKFYRPPGRKPQIETDLQSGELITSIDLPPVSIRRSHYIKVRDRNSYAFALVSVAAVVDADSANRIRDARFALGGVAPYPWRVPEAEQILRGAATDDITAFHRAAEIALRGAKPLAHNKFKVELARRAVARAFLDAQKKA
jgi:xanthine dehydrogenase YagS FAD-binding subunit